MSVKVAQKTDRTIFVNDKEVYKDTNENWIARQELTVNENRAFLQFIHATSQ